MQKKEVLIFLLFESYTKGQPLSSFPIWEACFLTLHLVLSYGSSYFQKFRICLHVLAWRCQSTQTLLQIIGANRLDLTNVFQTRPLMEDWPSTVTAGRPQLDHPAGKGGARWTLLRASEGKHEG